MDRLRSGVGVIALPAGAEMMTLRLGAKGRVWAPAALAAWLGAAWAPEIGVALWCAWAVWTALAVWLCWRGQTLMGPVVAWIAVALAAALGAGLAPRMARPEVDPGRRGQQPGLQVVRVVSAPLPRDGGMAFEARWLGTCPLDGVPGPICQRRWGRLRVQVDGAAGLAVGDVVRTVAFVSPPPGYANPGADGTASHWRQRGIYGRLRVRDARSMAWQPPDRSWLAWPNNRARRWQSQLRTALATRIERLAPGRPGGIMRALALGDRGGIDPQLRAWLRDSGTAHILAVSGAHVGLVVLGVAFLLQRLVWVLWPGLLRRLHLWRLLAAPCIAAAWTYALLAGASASTERAATMATLVLLARSVATRADLAEIVGLSALALLAFDPALVGDPGLCLSFLGVMGAVAGAGLFRAPRSKLAARVTASLGVSLGAWAWTSPISVPLFGCLPLAAPIFNLAVVPWVGLVLLPLALLCTLAAAAGLALGVDATPGFEALWRATIEAAVLPLSGLTAHTDGQLPVWWVGGPAAAMTGLALAAGFACVRLGRSRGWLPAMALIGLVALSGVGMERWRRPPPGTFDAFFLDVGHGDSAVLRLPDGRHWLIDGGGEVGDDGRVGERAVVPALRALGVRRVDVMISTHPHPDHENGLLAVARALPVGQLWFRGSNRGSSAEHRALEERLKARGTRLRDVDVQPPSSRELRAGGVQLRLVRPSPAPGSPLLHANDASLVLEVQAGAQRLLLAGDIEGRSEARLAAEGHLRPTEVLKVPHHGSRTSSSPALLDHARPTLGIAGARSWGRLPFPHPLVAARYSARGIALWVTELGMVHLRMGATGWCARQAGRSLCAAPSLAAPPVSGSARPRLKRQSAPPNSNQARRDSAAPAKRPGAR